MVQVAMSSPLHAELELPGFSWRRALGLSVVLWLGAPVIDVGKDSLAAWLLDQPLGWHLVKNSAGWWPMYIPLTPLVLALAHRVPMRRKKWWRVAPVHVLAAMAFALSHIFLARLVVVIRFDIFATDVIWRMFRTSFNQFFLFHIMVYAALVAGYWAMDYYRRYRDRAVAAAELQRLAATARFDALRWQLNPHFLFNSLNAVGGLVRNGDGDGAIEMLARISALLRSTLDEASTSDVTLARELELVHLYVDVERVRFRDRLTVDMLVDDDVLDAVVPVLILQPLVENAVRHGVSASSEPVHVELVARRTRNGLTVTVRDNGRGFPDGPGSVREGVGLSNTRERLMHRFGPAALVEIASAPGGGGDVRLVMPYERAGQVA